jgi:sporulation related protein
VTAVETPPPEIVEEVRRCPRCGGELTAEQEWCLNCGADVSSTIAAPPNWRGPAALVGVLLAIAAVALILALVELAGDSEQVAQQPAATPTAAATVAPTVAPESTTIPPATDNGTGTPEIADWPAGKNAWTVVLESSATRSAAETRANELAQQSVPVGILESDDFSSLEPGRFVVFSGQYDSQRAADQALKDLSGQVEGAYVRHVVPDEPTGGASDTPSPSPTVSPSATPDSG